MINKIFSLLILAFIFFGIVNVSAQYTSKNSSNWYNDVQLDNWLNFKAELIDWKVYTSWSAFSKDEDFKWYKIVRSTKKSNPVYPDDWYIKYYSNIYDTKYIDNKPSRWEVYYRVCAITEEKNRYCSNVVKLDIEKTNDSIVCTTEYSPVCWYKDWKYKTYSNKCVLKSDNAYKKYYWECNLENKKEKNKEDHWLSSKTKIKAKNIINKFIYKLDKKWYSNDKKVLIIDTIINKLDTLTSTKPKLSKLINYLMELLNDKKEVYIDDFSEIKDIFNLD